MVLDPLDPSCDDARMTNHNDIDALDDIADALIDAPDAAIDFIIAALTRIGDRTSLRIARHLAFRTCRSTAALDAMLRHPVLFGLN